MQENFFFSVITSIYSGWTLLISEYLESGTSHSTGKKTFLTSTSLIFESFKMWKNRFPSNCATMLPQRRRFWRRIGMHTVSVLTKGFRREIQTHYTHDENEASLQPVLVRSKHYYRFTWQSIKSYIHNLSYLFFSVSANTFELLSGLLIVLIYVV